MQAELEQPAAKPTTLFGSSRCTPKQSVLPRNERGLVSDLGGAWEIGQPWLNEDGTVRKLKARFVACGYSQIEGKDFNEIYASALSAPSYRFWICTVNDEGMCTDKIDAVKAFTQAEADCPLFAEMPEGFSRPDYCLRLLKAVEGIRQGAHLFYELQKYAWNKVGCFSDVCDPNFYRHKELDLSLIHI